MRVGDPCDAASGMGRVKQPTSSVSSDVDNKGFKEYISRIHISAKKQ